jgi:serine/threonine-protein kinase
VSAAAPEPRERVGPYQLIRAIGAGGSARIDLARIDRAYNFQRHVVVKRPLEHLRGSPQVAQSLRREARLGGRLRHPNLVAVLDAGEHGGYDYLVLEYVHGASLRTLMQTDQPGRVREIPLAVALGIAIDIARGLHEAHELTDEKGSPLGLVHRDVTPGNVLLGLDGSVKVADFGIAKETRVATLSGSMHGTVTYMAPEQCRGHAFDRRADVFSLGVIVYELLAHARLFWADNDVASLHRVLSGDVVPPRQLEPALSPALEQVVMTAIAGDPNKRFATARAFADSLEGLAATEGHILGARLVARTLEEAVGPKYAPWIGSTTVVDPPRKPEASLVAVIEASAPDIEPIFSTFGPADRRDAEEGEVPSAPSVAVVGAVRFPPKRRTGLVVGALAACIAAGVVVAFLLSSHKPAPPPSTVHVMAPPSRAPVLAPAVDPVPVPVAVPDPVPVAVPGPGSGSVHHHHHAATPPPPAGSASETGSATPPAPQPVPTPTPKPGDVEWNPTLFFPGSGSGSSK